MGAYACARLCMGVFMYMCLCVCLHMCLHMCVSVCVLMHVCFYVCVLHGCVPVYTHVEYRGLSLNHSLPFWLGWLAREHQGILLPSPPSTKLTVPPYLALFTWVLRIKLRLAYLQGKCVTA